MIGDSKSKAEAMKGKAIAQALAGAWRVVPPPVTLSSDELALVTPLLLETGAGALGWWRVRHSDLRATPAAKQLQQAYRLHALQAVVNARYVAQSFAALRSAGVEPILAKGWAAARRYPEPGLRPYGDIDLCVPREQYRVALASFGPGAVQAPVDLKAGLPELPDRSFDVARSRSRLVPLGNTEVRVLSYEDHLRLTCLHLLRHGAWRPLSLCDVAAALESLPEEFDWDYFLSGSRRHTAWVVCVMGLAHHLLGARVEKLPVEEQTKRLPSWLVSEVLRRWSAGHPTYESEPILTTLLRRKRVAEAIQQRWASPITVSSRWRWPHSHLPAVPYQVADFALQTFRYAKRLGRAGATNLVGRRAA